MRQTKAFLRNTFFSGIVVFSLTWMWVVDIIMDSSVKAACIGAAVTIAVAIVGGAISLYKEWKQSKRDGRHIEKIDAGIDCITPKVSNIEKLAESQSKDLGLLVSDLDYRKRVEAQFPSGSGRDLILTGVDRLFTQYTKNCEQLASMRYEVLKKENENQTLRAENQTLREENLQLKEALRKFNRSMDEPELGF